jgi:SET domain-containing protein
MILSSWTSPKTKKAQPSKIHNLGFFAIEDISKNEVLAIKAGHIIDKKTLDESQDVINHSQMQVTDNLYIAPMSAEEMPESMIYFNHSCEPNMGIKGQIVLFALRDIKDGEEITVDYATIFDDNSHFDCTCGAETCRKVVTGKDWEKSELQQKYGRNFSTFILEKIEKS